jgi:tRNA U34 2-thiouridine synthase MnmA/TrmU
VLEIVEREPIRSPNGPAMVKNASKDDSVDQCFVPAFRLCVGDGQARCGFIKLISVKGDALVRPLGLHYYCCQHLQLTG